MSHARSTTLPRVPTAPLGQRLLASLPTACVTMSQAGHHHVQLTAATRHELISCGMQERNRKLVAERTRLQRELAAAAERAVSAEGALAAAQQQVSRQGDLIATLEEDLVKAGCASRAALMKQPDTPRSAQSLHPDLSSQPATLPRCWCRLEDNSRFCCMDGVS